MARSRTPVLPHIGDCVHYVLLHGPGIGQHRPAFITKALDVGLANLAVANLAVLPDADDELPDVFHARGVPYDEHGAPGTYHVAEA